MRMLCAVAVTIALVGCGKKDVKLPPEAKAGDPPAVNSKSGPPGGFVPSGGFSSGGGGGGVQAPRGAAKRMATANELREIQLFIENFSAAGGKMPSAEMTFAALEKEAPKTAAAVKEGVIVLNMAKSRDDVWAYEFNALQSGGQVVTAQGVERMDADALKRRLGIK